MMATVFNKLKTWTFVIAIMAGITSSGSLAQETVAQGCSGKEIAVADLQWPSASILAHIHARLIGQHFDCSTRVVLADIENATTTLRAAQFPTIVPEMWPTRVAERWNQVQEDRAGFMNGSTYDVSALEGWFVPAKVLEDFPSLANVENLSEIAALYQLEQKPRFISCPATWACSVINRNMLAAHGLLNLFDVVVPENRIEMDRLIGAAASNARPTIFYYWQPNALLEQLDVAQIDLGQYVADAYPCLGLADCGSPSKSNFPVEQVGIASASWLRGDAPELLSYLRKAQMPIQTMNELLAWQLESEATHETAAEHFLTEYADTWGSWVP